MPFVQTEAAPHQHSPLAEGILRLVLDVAIQDRRAASLSDIASGLHCLGVRQSPDEAQRALAQLTEEGLLDQSSASFPNPTWTLSQKGLSLAAEYESRARRFELPPWP